MTKQLAKLRLRSTTGFKLYGNFPPQQRLDDCYEEALRWPGSLRLTLPRAIRHAQAMRDAVADPALQEEMRGRIRHRAQELRRVAPEHPLAGRDGTPLPSAAV